MILNKILSLFLCLFIPIKLSRFILNRLGHNINKSAKIGCSLIWGTKLNLGPNCKIGNFNIISVVNLEMQNGSLIRNMNIIYGLFTVILSKDSRIGKQNNITRSKSKSIVIGVSQLYIGELSCITKKTIIDLTSSLTIGNFSQIGGVGTQIWTHGYIHATSGPDRFRVDGSVNIGNNVYIGSSCLLNPGVSIGDSINIGGNSTVSKDLLTPGMYVSQPLRYLDKDYDTIKDHFQEVLNYNLIEKVYKKKND